MNLFTCPHCQSQFKAADEMRGKRVRCPQCTKLFTLADANAPPEKLDNPVLSPPDAHDDWRLVRSGLLHLYLCVVAAIFLSLASVLFVVLFGVDTGAGVLPRRVPLGTISAICLAVAVLSLGVLYAFGMFHCALVPERRAKMLLLGNLASCCLTMAITLLQAIFLLVLFERRDWPEPPRTGTSGAVIGLQGLNSALAMTGVVLLLLYLRRIAQVFDNRKLVRSYNHFLIYQVIGVLLTCALVALYMMTFLFDRHGFGMHRFPAREDSEITILLLIGFFALAGLLVYMLWFLSLLQRTRVTIAQGMGPRTNEAHG